MAERREVLMSKSLLSDMVESHSKKVGAMEYDEKLEVNDVTVADDIVVMDVFISDDGRTVN